MCFDFGSELSPVSQASDTENKPKRKRVKATNNVLSLNDNLHATFLFCYHLIIRYVTVDKVDDDKEKEMESQTKKAKLAKDQDDEGTILIVYMK